MEKTRRTICMLLCVALSAAVLCAGCDKSEGSTGVGGGTSVIAPPPQLIDGDNYVHATVRTAQPYATLSFAGIGGDEVMPIGGGDGWNDSNLSNVMENGVKRPDFCSDEFYRVIKESGLNFTPNNQARTREDILKALELGEKYGIGSFISVPELTAEGVTLTPALVQQYAGEYFAYDSCLGLQVRDEPQVVHFDAIAAIYQQYEKTGYADSKIMYSNLLPGISANRLGGEGGPPTEYSEYLRQFVRRTGSRILSYDMYPFSSQTPAGEDGIKQVPQNFFGDVSEVRRAAIECNVPFWCYVQAGGQWEGTMGRPSMPVFPNEAETLWNVNAYLAYGAKGIQYFLLTQPPYFAETNTDHPDYMRGSMVGAAGNLNQWYYYIRKANMQVLAVDHILMKSASMGVFSTGYFGGSQLVVDNPADIGANGRSWRELEDIVTSGEAGVLVGCFDWNFEGDRSRSAYYIVNNSGLEKQYVTLTFDKKYGYDVIQRGITASITAERFTLTLEKGEGVMVALR